MGNQKLKWTGGEEEALLAGIAKHGPGKWKNILRDPEFADQLIHRSNIDLKDKWRNLSVPPGTQGLNNKARPTKVKDESVALPPVEPATDTTPPLNSTIPSSLPPLSSELITDERSNIVVDTKNAPRSNIVVDTKNAPRYDGMIFEALSALSDANGSDVSSIFHFIEPRHEVPPNFRRVLSSRLRRLAAQGKLVKSQNFYKIPDPSSGPKTPAPKPKETHIKPRQSNNQNPGSQRMIEEASITAAYKVVEAENKVGVVSVAVQELEKTTKLAEKTEHYLELAKEIHEQCSRGETVVLD